MKFERLDVIIAAGLLFAFTGLSWLFAPSPVSLEMVNGAQQRVQLSEIRQQQLLSQPELPELASAWQQLNIDWQHCGLSIVNVPQTMESDPSAADEPPFWTGEVSGPAGVGTTCLYLAFQRYPMRLIALNVADHVITARYRLYGKHEPVRIIGANLS